MSLSQPILCSRIQKLKDSDRNLVVAPDNVQEITAVVPSGETFKTALNVSRSPKGHALL